MINQLVRFFLFQNLAGFLDLHAAQLRLFGHHVAHHVAEADSTAAYFQRRRSFFDLNLQLAVFDFALHQLLTKPFTLIRQFRIFFLRGRFGRLRATQQIVQREAVRGLLRRIHQQRHQPVFGNHTRARSDTRRMLFAHHADGILHQIANDALHVAAHIANFGEFRCFHLDERRADELRQPTGNFRLADTRRANHQDVLRADFLAHRIIHLGAAIAVAQRNCDSTLGFILTNNVAIQFPDDLPGRQFCHVCPSLHVFDDHVVVGEHANARRDM